ncbi:MAG: hypothetical protein K0R62_6708 [Nonomuraea muscovyensis]|nr:hypothetical protein [Nonomuraea muscovyensis]
MISVSNTITPSSSYRTGGLVTHVRLLKKLAVVTAAGLLAIGLGAATASSASAAGSAEKIYDITPSGEISSNPLQ